MEGEDRLENVNPRLFAKSGERAVLPEEEDDSIEDEIDGREVFDLIKDINDPEHPLTLEELNVVEQNLVRVDAKKAQVHVEFTPTIPHCSMATLIGLAIQVQLLRALPEHFKVSVCITPGSHSSEHSINKQLADKERVAAAMENRQLLDVVNQCLQPRERH